jgi:hypothetical protein
MPIAESGSPIRHSASSIGTWIGSRARSPGASQQSSPSRVIGGQARAAEPASHFGGPDHFGFGEPVSVARGAEWAVSVGIVSFLHSDSWSCATRVVRVPRTHLHGDGEPEPSSLAASGTSHQPTLREDTIGAVGRVAAIFVATGFLRRFGQFLLLDGAIAMVVALGAFETPPPTKEF